MKIYIMTDMEGISGICREASIINDTPAYEAARPLLCADVNAAIAGAFDGGATEVVVSDGHGNGFNFILSQMDERAVYERPNGAADYLPSLDESFEGVLLVGYHAMAGTMDAFLDHTQDPGSWWNYWIGGRKYGEIGQIAAIAGHYGVPVLLVTGDKAACLEAVALLGNVETVAVKEGIGRQGARCVHPVRARAEICAATKRAVERKNEFTPHVVSVPVTVRLEYFKTADADRVGKHPAVRRIDGRTVEREIEDIRHLLLMP